jgi:hypothetical protein
MKSCTGLWIVAPITRAIDDKAAKNLLGNTFKRQLKYDGIYSAVTFICSKTDDISRIEATESLRLGSQMQEIEDQISNANARRRAFAQDLKAEKDKKKDYIDTIEHIEEQIETYDELQDQVEDGKIVFAPGAQKRKRSSDTFQSRKKRRRGSLSDDEKASDADESEAAAGPEPSSEPLTAEQIDSKLNELKSLKKESRREKSKLDEGIRDLEAQTAEIDEEIEKLDASSSELCIAGIQDSVLQIIVSLLTFIQVATITPDQPSNKTSLPESGSLIKRMLKTKTQITSTLMKTFATTTKLLTHSRFSASAAGPTRSYLAASRRTTMCPASAVSSRLRSRNYKSTARS